MLKNAHIKPAVNQIHLHPYNHAADPSLLDHQSKHDIATEAYGSLASITSYPGGGRTGRESCSTPWYISYTGYFPLGKSQRSGHRHHEL
ncbi:hypothetical protein BYT27DRAFT_7276459 [Phlegmacium glaucopus]|nr:hypothetical protein BYT27DRAFT_7276459 [Phlegmacium glaucopus]